MATLNADGPMSPRLCWFRIAILEFEAQPTAITPEIVYQPSLRNSRSLNTYRYRFPDMRGARRDGYRKLG